MTSDNTQGTETTETTEVAQELPNLTSEQEIQALRSVHEFLSSFDRVPGFLASKWSQALDTVAIVANSLIGKAKANGTLTEDTAVTAESASQDSAQ
jgi:hypothetical protein